jgi:hypothetical protein
MTRIRLLALDLDGTLLNDKGEISPANAEWVNRAQKAGITVMVSTGRGFHTALPYAMQIGGQSPMVTANGGEIWLRPHELHRRVPLASETVAELHRLAKRHEDTWFWAYAAQGLFNRNNWVEDIFSCEWLKFGYYTENRSVLDQILAELKTWKGLEITNSHPNNIEVNAFGVSKASALEEVCRLIGCDMSEAAAIGDSLNDIAAIRACGLGIAMKNAQDAVKAAADVVTDGNNEDGVARAIREFILKA